MVQEREGVAGYVLCRIFDIDLQRARAEIEKIAPPLSKTASDGRLPLSAREAGHRIRRRGMPEAGS
jgi:hypothetical protein